MLHTVSYSPEDNKIRLYVGRVPRDEYEKLRAAGFVSTPKQDCDFVATWTPHREDLASEYLEDGEDIGDEDYSPLERSADRAERFEGYRDKRADEAGASADAFAAGPAAFGHQNRARAERQARRHDRKRTYAVSQWSKAEYWQQRTQGVISHALFKSSATVRRGRILTLEAEQRKHVATMDDYAKRFAAWQEVLTLDGPDAPIAQTGEWSVNGPNNPAGRLAYYLANSMNCYGEYVHPRNPERKASLYSLLTDPAEPITPREAARLWLENASDPSNTDSWSARWAAHYELRLGYERAMLAAEGGTAADADMEPGGWIGKHQIHGVNKSPVTGRVVSVKLMCPSGWHEDGPPKLKSCNIERLPEGAYRAPTDEERKQFATEKAEQKAAEKASKPKAPALINPTDADAERLQAIWNERAKKRHEERKGYGEAPTSAVVRMTQEQYSARSKSHGPCETSEISEHAAIISGGIYHQRGGRVCVFKVRTMHSGSMHSPQRVVILTDKPQKPLPWTAIEAARAEQPTEEKMRPRLGELYKAISLSWLPEGEQRQLIDDAAYLGWAFISSSTQFGFTEKGAAEYKQHCETAEALTVEV